MGPFCKYAFRGFIGAWYGPHRAVGISAPRAAHVGWKPEGMVPLFDARDEMATG